MDAPFGWQDSREEREQAPSVSVVVYNTIPSLIHGLRLQSLFNVSFCRIWVSEIVEPVFRSCLYYD